MVGHVRWAPLNRAPLPITFIQDLGLQKIPWKMKDVIFIKCHKLLIKKWAILICIFGLRVMIWYYVKDNLEMGVRWFDRGKEASYSWMEMELPRVTLPLTSSCFLGILYYLALGRIKLLEDMVNGIARRLRSYILSTNILLYWLLFLILPCLCMRFCSLTPHITDYILNFVVYFGKPSYCQNPTAVRYFLLLRYPVVIAP